MTAQEFDFLWKRLFPHSFPLPHLLRQDYRSAWVRIRSFDGNKRYPSNDVDIAALLSRQNDVLSTVLGNPSKVYGITGEYNFERDASRSSVLKTKVLRRFNFTELYPVNLHEVSRTDFKPGDIYRMYLTEINWNEGEYNDLLEAIAFDEARMLFLNPLRKNLAAPFDGGVDVIALEPGLPGTLKLSYNDWLSKASEQKV